jgi:trimethylamine--corrinoid protein Co-methyltransferase
MIRTAGLSTAEGHYSRLRPEECEAIHNASLEILERIGVQVHEARARQVLVSAGARAEGKIVRVPSFVVEEAIQSAPKRMTLYDLEGRPAIQAHGYNTYFGGGSDCLYVLDHRTGARRKATRRDVIEAQILQEALPEIDFRMSTFLPSDVSGQIYDRHQMEIMLRHGKKPIVFVAPDFQGAAVALEMAEAVAGGAEAFRQRPFAVCYINVTAGLIANREALQKCMFFAEKGLPQLWIPLNGGGVHAPCSIPGSMAALNAGTLLGVTLAQLVRPGSHVGVPGWSGGFYNMQNLVGNYCLADEQGVALAMGHYYGFPTFGLGGATDSKILDQQAGLESALGLLTQTLEGANLLHDIGFTDAGMQGSLALMAICNDIIGWIRAATCSVTINEESLDRALEVIAEVGPGGTHLDHEYTLKHFREAFYPQLLDRNIHSKWADLGAATVAERASAWVDELLETHEPDPPPEEVQAELARILRREQARIEEG